MIADEKFRARAVENPFEDQPVHLWSAADDLESLIRVVYLLVHGHPEIYSGLCEADKKGLSEIQRWWRDNLPGAWADLSEKYVLNGAERCDYEGLKKAFCDLVPK